MSDLTDGELALLRLLAEERDRSGPPGYLETAAAAERLGVPVARVRRMIHTLWTKGLVGTDEVDLYAVYLLPEGHEAVARAGAS